MRASAAVPLFRYGVWLSPDPGLGCYVRPSVWWLRRRLYTASSPAGKVNETLLSSS